MDTAALILTLRFDDESFARFDADRRLHFPPSRNFIPAHLTLFHHLPGELISEINGGLATLAAETAPFRIPVRSLRFLGQGTAYEIDSPELQRLRADIRYRSKGALRDVGKALGLPEDLIRTLSSQVWAFSKDGVGEKEVEALKLVPDRRLLLALIFQGS